MSTTTTITELKRMTPQELRKELEIKRTEVAKMRLGLALQSEKNSGLYRAHRKEIARMTMVLSEMTNGTMEVPAKEKKEVSAEKPSQAKKKSVKRSGSTSKKQAA